MPILGNERFGVLVFPLLACSGAGEDGGMGPTHDAGQDMHASDAAMHAGDAAAPMPSFTRDVQPVFTRKCIRCHHPDSAIHVDLTQPFAPEVGIIGRETGWVGANGAPLVDPGRPENSFLIVKITSENHDVHEIGSPMPWHVPRLTSNEIAALRQWITDGAQDDAFYRDTVKLIFGDGLTLGSRTGKCAHCHYTGGSLRPNLMDPFDPEAGVVDIVGAHGRTLVVPGDPDASFLIEKVADENLDPSLGERMPFWPPRVTAEEVVAIERWIAAGAPDN